jgi:hypothetical protein
MHTHGRDGLAAAVHEVTERTKALARLEAELATLELRSKVRALGFGVVLVTAAAVLALFGAGFALATLAAALATAMPVWLALLIVTGVLFLLGVALGAFGAARLRSGVPPIPEQAIDEARLTTRALRTNGRP